MVVSMSRYINADVFMKNLKTNEHGDTDANQVEIAIDKSRADVAEVVRCKYCKYSRVADMDDQEDGYLCSLLRGHEFFSYDYCSYGEREDDE